MRAMKHIFRSLALALTVGLLFADSTFAQTCPIGTFSETGEEPCTECEAGTFTVTTGSTVCTDCPPGRFQPIRGESTCLSCVPGTFAANEGSTTCTFCEAGTFAATAESTICNNCPGGAATNNLPGANACIDTTADECDPGKYKAGVCTDCPAGTSAPGGQDFCVACSAGQFASEAGRSVCLSCSDGFATEGAIGMTECYACLAGTAAEEGDESCSACAEGSFSSEDEAAVCSECEADTFAAATGSTVCAECESGFKSDAGAAVCTAIESVEESAASSGCGIIAPGTNQRPWAAANLWLALAAIFGALFIVWRSRKPSAKE